MTNRHSCKIPVLMYHAIEDANHPAGAKDPGEQLYVLSRDSFYAQMEYLSLNGFTVLSFDDLSNLDEWPEKGIVITFDDGHQSNYTLALPILKQFGFHAHFFITTDWIDTPYFLTSFQVKQLVDHGMNVGSHGVTHSFFSDMAIFQIQKELQLSKQTLEQCSSGQITLFSAPGGRVQSIIVRIGKEIGYRLFCTSEFALLTSTSLPDSVPRLAVKENTDIATFQKMVNGDAKFFLKYKVKDFILATLKVILGNIYYEKLRNYILAFKYK